MSETALKDLTREEVKRFEESFKNEQFRKLFFEYMEEISDPKNREQYEKELVQLEAERNVQVRFIKPVPFMVVKSWIASPDMPNEKMKVFVNICTSPEVDPPVSSTVVKNNKRGQNWSIPYSLGPSRDDTDNEGARCIVYDCVFNPKLTELSTKQAQLRETMIGTAIEAVEKHLGKPVARDYRVLKMKSKGTPVHTIIRSKSTSNNEKEKKTSTLDFIEDIQNKQQKTSSSSISESKSMAKAAEEPTPKKDGIVRPEHTLTYQYNNSDYQKYTNSREKNDSNRPDRLVVRVKLPNVESVGDINLDVSDKYFDLQVPTKYALAISLPFSVNSDNGDAKFDKPTQELIVTLPVVDVVSNSSG